MLTLEILAKAKISEALKFPLRNFNARMSALMRNNAYIKV